MELLRDRGAQVAYSDPHIPVFPTMRRYRFSLESSDLSPQVLAQADCVILATDHDAFDYKLIRQYSKLIVDTRGRYRENSAHVIKA
jgi:UDP-N-acetyl-D-glucosamine dehydrogenase